MLRPSFIAAFALAVIVTLPTLASADECTCFVAETTISTSTRRFQSVEVGPLFSSDGASLTSTEAADGRAWLHAGLPVQNQVLVCVSPNDPRCSPRDSAPDHGPLTADGARYASSRADTSSDRRPNLGATLRPLGTDGARSGVRDRLERPPRT